MEGLEDEEDRSGHGSSGQQGESKKSGHHSSILDGDLASLKRKFPWLADFSDTCIRGAIYRGVTEDGDHVDEDEDDGAQAGL